MCQAFGEVSHRGTPTAEIKSQQRQSEPPSSLHPWPPTSCLHTHRPDRNGWSCSALCDSDKPGTGSLSWNLPSLGRPYCIFCTWRTKTLFSPPHRLIQKSSILQFFYLYLKYISSLYVTMFHNKLFWQMLLAEFLKKLCRNSYCI